jgi:magnesium transporter
LVDSYRDLLSGAAGMYLSTVANRQGQINKQLAVIATILSDVVFGLGSLVISVIGFAVYFRRKRWL